MTSPLQRSNRPRDESLNGSADVAVLGAGHNGLIAAAYLARAGLRTLLFEARPTVGGCASTVEAVGARVNICNCDHLLVRAMPIADELGLADHGLRYLDVDPVGVQRFWDGHTPWVEWHSLEATLDGLRRTYPGEVDGYRRFVTAARPVAELLVELAQQPPSPAGVAGVLGRRPAATRRLWSWSRRSAQSLLADFFGHEALILPALATGPVVWGLDGSTPGTGLGALGYALRHLVQVGRPTGGSGGLTDAVLGSFEAAGGHLHCGTPVQSVLLDGGPGTAAGRVRGVKLAGGEVREVGAVVVACDPAAIALEGAGLPDRLGRIWAPPGRDGYESKVDAVLETAPIYSGTPDGLDGAGSLIPTTFILPGIDGLRGALASSAAGRVGTDPVFFANVPSALDPQMRAPGRRGCVQPRGPVHALRPRRRLEQHRRARTLAGALRRMGSAGVRRVHRRLAGHDPTQLRAAVRHAARPRRGSPARPFRPCWAGPGT